jgi:uncharacterized membrane protein
MRDIMSMLKDSGSRMMSQKGHLKYELPNGKLFVCPKTPSDYRGVRNCLSALRRELRHTHPAIADRGRNIRKKTALSNTIGDLLQSKKSISAFSAIPGSEPVPEKEIDFTIIAMPEDLKVEEQEPVHRSPRKIRAEQKPKPSSYRTLTTEQMEEANRLLHAEGDEAMNTFINQCKTEEHFVRRAAPAAPLVPAPVLTLPTSEDDFMSQLLERARNELSATNVRLEEYEKQFAALKAQQDQDVLKQTQLEQYIAKHEQLAAEAADLLPLLPSLPVVVEEGPTKKRGPGKAAKAVNLCGYGIGAIRERVFPQLVGKEFRADDVLRLAESLPAPHPSRAQLHTWLLAEVNRKGGNASIERTGIPGWFRVSSMKFLPPAVPVSQVAHA